MTPDDVLARIDPNEVVELALALGNIDSPTGSEGEAGRFVRDWLAANGFAPKTYALTEDRINVAAWIHGSGGGHSLIFNAHLDTTLRPDAVLSARDPLDPLYHSAWVDGDEIYGDGVVNDKGPMAAFLVAGKAIREAGYPLKGDLIVSAVAGEISREPIDEWQGPAYLSKDLGARFMITHGAVADYAIVAEGTGFGIVGIEPGKAHFKVTVVTDTPRYYTPYLPRPTGLADAPNAIVRTGAVIAAFETWAYDYQQRQTYRGEHGTIVPKASINAIRSGYPYNLTSAPQVCQFFVDTRILPGANPTRPSRRAQGRPGGRRGRDRGAVPLSARVRGTRRRAPDRDRPARARPGLRGPPGDRRRPGHQHVARHQCVQRARDPGHQLCAALDGRTRAKKSFKVKDLTDAAVVYARIAMDLCNQDRVPFTPLGAHPNRAIAASINDH